VNKAFCPVTSTAEPNAPIDSGSARTTLEAALNKKPHTDAQDDLRLISISVSAYL